MPRTKKQPKRYPIGTVLHGHITRVWRWEGEIAGWIFRPRGSNDAIVLAWSVDSFSGADVGAAGRISHHAGGDVGEFWIFTRE